LSVKLIALFLCQLRIYTEVPQSLQSIHFASLFLF